VENKYISIETWLKTANEWHILIKELVVK